MVREHYHHILMAEYCIDCMRDIWLVGIVGNFFCMRGSFFSRCLIRSALGIDPSLSDQFLHPVNSVLATAVGEHSLLPT